MKLYVWITSRMFAPTLVAVLAQSLDQAKALVVKHPEYVHLLEKEPEVYEEPVLIDFCSE